MRLNEAAGIAGCVVTSLQQNPVRVGTAGIGLLRWSCRPEIAPSRLQDFIAVAVHHVT